MPWASAASLKPLLARGDKVKTQTIKIVEAKIRRRSSFLLLLSYELLVAQLCEFSLILLAYDYIPYHLISYCSLARDLLDSHPLRKEESTDELRFTLGSRDHLFLRNYLDSVDDIVVFTRHLVSLMRSLIDLIIIIISQLTGEKHGET